MAKEYKYKGEEAGSQSLPPLPKAEPKNHRDVKAAALNRDIKAGINRHNRRVEAEKKVARRWKLIGDK